MSTIVNSSPCESEKPRLNRWLSYMGEEDAKLGAAAEEAAIAGQSPGLALSRVERLLNRLEVSVAAPARPHQWWTSTRLTIAGMGALWLSIMLLAIGYMRSSAGDGRRGPDPIATAANAVASADVTSVDRLTEALVSSSKKLVQLKRDMARARRRLASVETEEAESVDAAKISVGALSHFKSADEALAAVQGQLGEGATPYRDSDSGIDYWLMTQGPKGDSPARVVAVGKAKNGIVVQNLEDNKYYLLKAGGHWRRIALRRKSQSMAALGSGIKGSESLSTP